ncbi:Polypyrimidine tract-binding protein like 3 [Dendrobium catenatum]|uniref:Polypyrimidine tract-binding protein like 3 n=1 Tax=Dendrobium catenatum TaxID=906689 RepID=A0A2I0VKC7_9ASPA|nr:Polypyrimidine tract-binding protein like 3 [Dendrobium catenatum]
MKKKRNRGRKRGSKKMKKNKKEEEEEKLRKRDDEVVGTEEVGGLGCWRWGAGRSVVLFCSTCMWLGSSDRGRDEGGGSQANVSLREGWDFDWLCFQALIQYHLHQSALQAKIALQGRNIYDGCCQLDIQFSNLNELQVNYNNDRSRPMAEWGCFLSALLHRQTNGRVIVELLLYPTGRHMAGKGLRYFVAYGRAEVLPFLFTDRPMVG